MIKRLFPAALIAGLSAGLVISLAQAIFIIPLIDFAEFLEIGGRADDYVPPKGFMAIALSDVERFLNTLSFDVLTGVAFALIMAAGIVFHGRAITWKQGILWGLGGWAAFALAPAIGQPPAPPGVAYVDLEARQLWWWLTVSCTSLGLVMLVFIGDWAGECGRLLDGGWRNAWWPKVVGAGLIIFPHVLGAPENSAISTDTGTAGADMVRDFAFYSLTSTLAFWVIIGIILGAVLGRGAGDKN